jgi:endonuclease/exonuclease/phosphatase family metal-dependent hydrolase
MSASNRTLRLAARRHGAALALLLAAFLAGGREARAENELAVLSYNVRGLPPLIAQDRPRSRAKAIGSLASAYDVVLFQEDFEYHSVLRKRMEGSVGVAGNGAVFDVRRLAGRILLAPVTVFLRHFSVPYGAGLSTFVKSHLTQPDGVRRAPYNVCDGWFGNSFDCWASKGYLRVRIGTPAGGLVDVYSTHLDAGQNRRSIKTRRRQLHMLAAAIEEHSRDRAVILGGDLNLAVDHPRDQRLLDEFRDRLGLHDSGAGPELPIWSRRDYILYRSGAGADLSVAHAGEALEFVAGSQALSDHPAVYARFRVSAMPASAALLRDEASGSGT